jgi:hypothetical protein
MNEILAQAYGTREKLASAQSQEKTAEAALLDELIKVAEAEGVDLNQLDDNDIAEILAGAMGAVGQGAEKTASAEELSDEDNAKLQEADFLGRVMAHAMFDEMSSIQGGEVEKTASAEETEFLQAFEAMSVYKANEILAALGVEEAGEHVKTAAPYQIDDPQLETAVIERAGELLDEAGWDVDAIAQALERV